MRAARCWQKAGSLSFTPGDSRPGSPARATSAAARETNASAEQRSRRQDLELPRKNPKITKEGKIMSGLFLLLRRAREDQAQGFVGFRLRQQSGDGPVLEVITEDLLEIDDAFRGRRTEADPAFRVIAGDIAITGLFVKVIEVQAIFYFARTGFPAAESAEGLAGPQPAVDSGAQDRLDGVQPFCFRPKRSRGLGQLPGVFQALANDHLAGARVWITPAANRIHGRGQKVGDGPDGFLEIGLGRGEGNQFGQACQRVTGDVRFGVPGFEAALVFVYEGRVRIEGLAALIEEVAGGELGAQFAE